MANVNFDTREEAPQQGRYLGKGPLLCRADGCSCLAQSGTRGIGNDPDAPGLCIYHGAVEDTPEAWRAMTEMLTSLPVRGLIFLCTQLEKLPIDRDEKKKLDGTLRPESEWKRRRWVDSDYLSAKTREWIENYSDFFGFDEEVKHRRMGKAQGEREFWLDRQHENPKAYGIRVHQALIAKLVQWSMPAIQPSNRNIPDEATLRGFFERNRKVFKEVA